MALESITESLTECRDVHGQTIVYCKLNGELYVIAKSVVKVLTETDYLCGENPYINRIIELLPEAAILLPVVGEALLSKVWDNPGRQKDVYFVEAAALIDHLEELFPEAGRGLVEEVRLAMRGHLETLV